MIDDKQRIHDQIRNKPLTEPFTLEEWRELYPVLEMEMREKTFKIMLCDDKGSHKASIPVEYAVQLAESILAKWKEFQDGTALQEVALWRNYLGAWENDIRPPEKGK
jgi:hypothetical protein